MSDAAICLAMGSIVNLTTYPLDQPNSSEYLDFLQTAHDTFHREGLLVVLRFLFQNIAAEIAEELLFERNQSSMCAVNVHHNIYQRDEYDHFYPATHPRNALMHTQLYTLPADEITESSARLEAVYDWDLLIRFISAVISENASDPQMLHQFGDPASKLSVNVLCDGNIVNWHFDSAEFTVLIALQSGEEGGEYVMAPDSLYNSRGRYNYRLHHAIIREIELESKTKTYTFSPGDLIMHRGSHSVHRINRIHGETPRLGAVLQYAKTEGGALSLNNRGKVYCRGEKLKYSLPQRTADFTIN